MQQYQRLSRVPPVRVGTVLARSVVRGPGEAEMPLEIEGQARNSVSDEAEAVLGFGF
jgi:hypothetical protein